MGLRELEPFLLVLYQLPATSNEIIEVAVSGNYGTALQAFTINPLLPSGHTAKRIMDELFLAHKSYLLQFAKAIEKLEHEGITIKDELARNLAKEQLV